MKNLLGNLGIGSAAIALALGVAPAAQALEFTFAVSGWSGGGLLSGSFSGDTGDNEILSLDELDTFVASFDGNPDFTNVYGDTFSIALDDLNSFSLDTDSLFLKFESETSAAEVEIGSSGFGSIRDDDFGGGSSALGTNFTFTVTQVGGNETAVPTPAAVLPGLFGMGLSAIRKRKGASSEDA